VNPLELVTAYQGSPPVAAVTRRPALEEPLQQQAVDLPAAVVGRHHLARRRLPRQVRVLAQPRTGDQLGGEGSARLDQGGQVMADQPP
jgi:hypothetical protein